MKVFNVILKDAYRAAEEIIKELDREMIKDKVIILKVSGVLDRGKSSDIEFIKVEEYAKKKEAYVLLKSTSKLRANEPEIKVDILDGVNLENQIIEKYEESNPGKFNNIILSLMKALQAEKKEDEKAAIFEERVFSEARKILKI